MTRPQRDPSQSGGINYNLRDPSQVGRRKFNFGGFFMDQRKVGGKIFRLRGPLYGPKSNG